MQFSIDEFAANLRALRARKHVSQGEVAQAIGVDPNTVSNYELGNTSPSYLVVWKLADYYGVTLDEIGGRSPVKAGE